jgi:hypothetical protein
MFHLRIVGIVWLLLGIFGTCLLLFEFFHSVARHAFAGAIESDLIALVFCVTAAFAGYGAFRRRPWARVVCGIVGVVLLLYALSYLLISVGLEYGVTSYVVMWTAALFSVYSLIVIVKYRQ